MNDWARRTPPTPRPNPRIPDTMELSELASPVKIFPFCDCFELSALITTTSSAERKVLHFWGVLHFLVRLYFGWMSKQPTLLSKFLLQNGSIKIGTGPWWWSSGQRSHLLLQRSEFESCWLLKIIFCTKINKTEAGVGPPLNKDWSLGLLVEKRPPFCCAIALSTYCITMLFNPGFSKLSTSKGTFEENHLFSPNC